MLPDLNEMSTCQSAPTQDTIYKCNQVLDYASNHKNSNICYHGSDMILMKDKDSDYLVLLEARTLIAGYYYFINRMLNYYKVVSTLNIPILTEYNTLKTVLSSSVEAETGGTFENATNVIPLRHILETVYLHQQPTKRSPIITDNLTYSGILTSL